MTFSTATCAFRKFTGAAKGLLMKLCRMIVPVCLAASYAAVFAVSQTYAQYQRAWTVDGWLDRRDYGADVTLDAAGNVYSAGYTEDVYGTPSSALYSGGVAAKFDPAGTRQWLSNAYSGRSLDHVADIKVDALNNVFIAGETYRYGASVVGSESFLIKFAHDGTHLWERHLGTPNNESSMSLSVDALGNAYIGGSTTGDLVGAGKRGGPFVAKYDPNGALLWVKQYADPALNPYPLSMSISPGHGIYLGFGGTIDGGLARLDEAGQLLWFQKPNYSAIPSLHTDIYGVTSDDVGNVYAAGMADFAYTSGRPFTGGRAVVAKHGPDGALLWSETVPTPFQSSAADVTLDLLGNIYVCGGTAHVDGALGDGDSDAFWAKFSPQGDLLWYEQWGTWFAESAAGLAVDQAGRVFVVATQFRTLNDYFAADGDVSVIRFDPIPEPSAECLTATMAIALVTATRWRKWATSSR
jgi:hypothetical protein